MNSFTVKGIPTSFVKSNMKFPSDGGSGEARLFVGNKSKFNELNAFFGLDDSDEKYKKITAYTVMFDKNNFLDYMKYVKIEHVFQLFNKYNAASLEEWEKSYNEIKDLNDDDFIVHLYTVNDKNRYYVRADEKIFKEYLRSIIVPKISDIIFFKDEVKKIIEIHLAVNYSYTSNPDGEDEQDDFKNETTKGIIESANILFYGVPGCGKSHMVGKKYESKVKEEYIIRVVFHPDYTYSDFVGQIMPVLEKVENKDGIEEEKLQYKFIPGPFTRILQLAEIHKDQQCLLIIEELNRGNAPAIFGEIFQLLDRKDDGESKYGIYNADIAKYAYGGLPENQGKAIDVIANTPIKLPPNLTIVATMNTSDQNVFTMDTAFQRRWQMKHIPNRFTGKSLDDKTITHVAKHLPNSDISWGVFAQTVNKKMHTANLGFGGTDDKSLGVYFATDNDLDNAKRFAEKVLKYLWDDAFKLGRQALFSNCSEGLSSVIEAYEDAAKAKIEKQSAEDPLKAVLVPEVYSEMQKRMLELAAEQPQAAEEEPAEAAEDAAADNPAQEPADEE